MLVGYAEAKNMVFPKTHIMAALFSHENINSHQSVPFRSDLFGLRPERISSFHPDASAQRSRRAILWSIVRFELSGAHFRAPAHFGRLTPG